MMLSLDESAVVLHWCELCTNYKKIPHTYLYESISYFKGIVSDSSNIFLWHESEDINKKCLFPKFQLIPILRFQVMHDYV